MNTVLKVTGCILLLVTSQALFAQDDSKGRQKDFNLEKGLAIQGYDPVAYFTEAKAIEGKESISCEVKGATYRFDTELHKQTFLASPEKFEPQYGGWCAYAMGSSGEKVEIDPKTFKVLNGKLYLFYNAYFNNTLKKWNEDEKGLKNKADVNWNKLIKL